MLEVTILKVQHSGTREARKLLPYIQNCDVFGPEDSIVTEKIALDKEKDWEKIIKSDESRFRFIGRTSDKIREIEWHPERAEYLLKVYDYLFREQKPLWFPEKCSEEERKNLLLPDGELDVRAFKAFSKGDMDVFFAEIWEYVTLMFKQAEKRDQIIAKNLRVAETSIRNQYPSLASKEPVRYTFFVGFAHEPEKYLDGLVKTVDLSTALFIPSKRVQKAALNGELNDDYKKDTLIWLYLSFFNQAEQEKLEKMNVPELASLLRGVIEAKRKFLDYK